MTPAPIPADEADRLTALRELLLLDTPPEERYDRLARFAAEQLNVPIALLTLVDGQRQWFKSRIGLEVAETTRDISFCGHAIMKSELFVIEDASVDPRFFDNPLVTGEPNIRFYAGAPLQDTRGHNIGTLCVIDTKPRKLDQVELAILDALRKLANETLSGKEGEE
ncbi:GAF domain-containing protein [Acidovorax sp. A1169]|uniref:GAF domain-containing protein n=1 Tax=Acidovorax sp. A1169 TaxID=3059524 RepID=UPI0027379A41|nr:GAF domain-containing protein [Acidovorax sp. A1169]MDP4075103.1 GAF domain-containing protein [Acidovorax sp. A1169]